MVLTKRVKMKLKLLVVIYNKSLVDNITIRSVKTSVELFPDFEIIVWDNSTDIDFRADNESHAKEMSLTYLTDNENSKLSYIYNKIINDFYFDYLIISDDDSEYSEEYFCQLNNILQKDPIVTIPRVYARNKLRSPAKMGLIVGKHLNCIEPGIHKNLIAITSGMVISSKIKEIMSPVFDENLSFYGVDTDFFLRLSEHNVSVNVMNVNLVHEMSMYSESYKLTKKNLSNNFRYINNKKATIYICSKKSYFRGILARIYYVLYEFLKIK